jgi:hypothetical protein
MDISLLGFKLNLEVLILIGIIYMILVSHTVCGCCNVPGIMEAFGSRNSGSSSSSNKKNSSSSSGNKNSGSSSHSSSGSSSQMQKLMKAKMMSNQKEGFTGANTNYGQSSPYTLGQYTPVDTSLWGGQDLTVTPGQPLSPAVQSILDRPQQPVPLPEGEMLMFANTQFGPEFCPNTYSNSMGCAAMTSQQYNYLITRGGNNVPYSEY